MSRQKRYSDGRDREPLPISRSIDRCKKFHEIISPHVSHGKGPFRRWIDAWWLGLCIGHHQDQRLPLPERSHCTKFNDGGILSSDPWRITHLELLVLAEEGEEVLSGTGACDPVSKRIREQRTEMDRR